MKKTIILTALLCSLQSTYILSSEQSANQAQYQATTGFIYAQEIVQAARYFNRSYHHCPTELKEIGLDNIQQLTADLLVSATVNENCQVTITYNNQAPVAKELQAKTISITPNTKDLKPLEGECSFNGATELAPPKDCKIQSFPLLTLEETKILDRFVSAYRTHNPSLLRADTFNEVNSLILLPKMMVKQFYTNNKHCPTTNQEANLSAPEKLSVRFLKGIEVSGCKITATFKDEPIVPAVFQGKQITYTLDPSNNTWLCQTDLAQADRPKDCQ